MQLLNCAVQLNFVDLLREKTVAESITTVRANLEQKMRKKQPIYANLRLHTLTSSIFWVHNENVEKHVS